jgi:hypothetical protein
MQSNIHKQSIFKATDDLIEKLQTNFDGIQEIINEMTLSKTILSEKITQFKTMYTELVKNNKTKIFLFCLDSLYFQYKSSIMDLDAMEQNRKFIMNRMYSDYYKLYHIIVYELNEKKILEIELKTYPQYKDLDVLYEYSTETITKIHSDILLILYKLYEKFKTNQLSVQEHVDTKKSVLSISNFLNTLKFDNGLLENQIMLYINYMAFFQFSQKKMLIRLYSKMSDFNKDIEEYLNFDNVISIDDIGSNKTEEDQEVKEEEIFDYDESKNNKKTQTETPYTSPTEPIYINELINEFNLLEQENYEENMNDENDEGIMIGSIFVRK